MLLHLVKSNGSRQLQEAAKALVASATLEQVKQDRQSRPKQVCGIKRMIKVSDKMDKTDDKTDD